MKTKKFGDAARSVTGGGGVSDYQSFLRKCRDVLGPEDKIRWEDIIWQFIEKGVLHVIIMIILIML